MQRASYRPMIAAAGFVMLLLCAVTYAQNPTTDQPASETASTTTLDSLLSQLGLAYSQPDPAKPSYRVTMESGGEVSVFVCTEVASDYWEVNGSPMRYAVLVSQITPKYAKDVEIPRELLMKIAELNDTAMFGHFGVYKAADSGEWSVWVNAHMLMEGSSTQELLVHLHLAHNATVYGKKAMRPILDELQQ